MANLNHWTSKLVEFGTTLQLLKLIEEKKHSQSEIEYHTKHVADLEKNITELVENFWTEDEIAEAKKLFELSQETK